MSKKLPAKFVLETITSELVKIEDLKPHPRNYKWHPPDQIQEIKASILRRKQYRNIVVTMDGTILAGHGVVEALIELGAVEVEAKRVALDANEPEALALMVGDNELGARGSRDDTSLAKIMKELVEADRALLLGTGIDEEMIARLGGKFAAKSPDEFEEFDETIETNHECPKCGYEWS